MTEHPQLKPPFEKIIIVGAGPSGLILALLLAQHDIPTIVLESWSDLDTRLRATQYGPPASRVFRRAGFLPEIREGSIPRFPAICWRRVADGKKLAEIDMSIVQEEEDRMSVMPLGQMIQIIYKHCTDQQKSKGLIDVRFDHKVINVGQDASHAWVDVEIVAEDKSKHTTRITADYLIGCDGARSAIRRALFGGKWPGQTWDCRFITQNVWYDGFEKYGWDGGNYMVDNQHWGLIARRGHNSMWRVTYGDPAMGLSDEEYLARRPWHFKAMLPGAPDEHEYRIEKTNMYNIQNRCAPSFKVGRIMLAGDSAHICNPMGGYGCMSAVLDVDGLADCLIGYHQGKADEGILDTWAQVRRDIFLKYVDARSIKNLDRVWKSDPWTVAETDKFFGILRGMEQDPAALKHFLLKTSSIEHDFTKHYQQPMQKAEPNGDA